MARKTKLDPEIQEKIVTAIQAGNYIETASAYAGINKSTLYDWLKRGNKARSGKFYEFSNAVGKALADSEVRDVALIGKAGQRFWQAVAWRLERRFSKRWGRKDHTEIEHSGGMKIDLTEIRKSVDTKLKEEPEDHFE